MMTHTIWHRLSSLFSQKYHAKVQRMCSFLSKLSMKVDFNVQTVSMDPENSQSSNVSTKKSSKGIIIALILLTIPIFGGKSIGHTQIHSKYSLLKHNPISFQLYLLPLFWLIPCIPLKKEMLESILFKEL